MSGDWPVWALGAIDAAAVVWALLWSRRARARTERGLAALGAAVAPLLDAPAPPEGPACLLLRWECSQCSETGVVSPAMFGVPPFRWHRHFRLEKN